jgi:hypothetical protein
MPVDRIRPIMSAPLNGDVANLIVWPTLQGFEQLSAQYEMQRQVVESQDWQHNRNNAFDRHRWISRNHGTGFPLAVQSTASALTLRFASVCLGQVRGRQIGLCSLAGR